MIRKPQLLELSTTAVVFAVEDDCLRVLLLPEGKSHWRLPGGGLDESEDLDACALRHVHEQTGHQQPYIEQLYTFSSPAPRRNLRMINAAYFALLAASGGESQARWFNVNELPSMISDHADIIGKAHERLRAKLGYSTIALQLMPGTFTLGELQSVYETILNEPMDKRNFRKRMLALNSISDTGEVLRNGKHRPARLYTATDQHTVEFIR